jgi:hypothetical protein
VSVDNPTGGVMTVVFIPRHPRHLQSVSAGPARFFAGVMPAAISFEEFFVRYAELPAEERGTDAGKRPAL